MSIKQTLESRLTKDLCLYSQVVHISLDNVLQTHADSYHSYVYFLRIWSKILIASGFSDSGVHIDAKVNYAGHYDHKAYIGKTDCCYG